ncbi:MAG: hypothetical protein PHI47_10560 [Sulfuricurvum sp.]|uniref:hypothetical protein n=1 Tax=Sulfuricurvum sp. TaxID=2025608 RepID=UPI00261798B0|nr:hypothetical protein [Sulfuricurvum sp.]MDD5160483.1 hypothetical protein [Sulfuricurvum sp.]
MQSLQEISEKINLLANAYKVGGLQKIRKEIGGLKRLPSKYLFDHRTIYEKWGWHYGGRKELQFNIGIEGNELRYGVAFSLECSQSLPNIDVLIPKIALFNEYLSEYGEAFSDLRMWHYQGERSEDYMPSPIPQEKVREGIFIFLGKKQPLDYIEYNDVLKTLDRLLPLYLYTEKANSSSENNLDTSYFNFIPGCTEKLSNTSGTIAEKELNIRLKHNDLQLKLYNQLVGIYGQDNVGTEIKTNNGSIDLVVQRNEKYWFYEIKTASTAQTCIRQALGQIMEYAFWPKNQEAEKIIIVGEPKASHTEETYLESLRIKFSLPIEYQSTND